MILWRRTLGVGLGLVAASSLWTVAQAYPGQPEGADAPGLTQVDSESVESVDTTSLEEPTDSLAAAEPEPAEAPVGLEDPTEVLAVEAPAPEVSQVPIEVLENLSQEQVAAIAAIISTAEESASTATVANLPAEVLTHLDALPGVERRVGLRRWLPTSLARRLRLPQMIASLVRQPKNAALVMLGNHIVVVNPVTGAVLGAVMSAL